MDLWDEEGLDPLVKLARRAHREACEQKVTDDYNAAVGSIRSTRRLYVMTQDPRYRDMCVPVEHNIVLPDNEPPVRIMVVDTGEWDLTLWLDTWLRPRWWVKITDPHPKLPKNITMAFVQGPAYSLDDGYEPGWSMPEER